MPAAAAPSDAVLERLRARIRAFAASRVGQDVADDVAQDVLVVLLTKYADKTEIEDLVPLAIRILQFKLIAYTRKRIRRGEHIQAPLDTVMATHESDERWADPEREVERRELRERLRAGLGKLDGRCRTVFRLKLEGRTYIEIREAMDAPSLNAVYLWDHRCRQRLKMLMGDGRAT